MLVKSYLKNKWNCPNNLVYITTHNYLTPYRNIFVWVYLFKRQGAYCSLLSDLGYKKWESSLKEHDYTVFIVITLFKVGTQA